MNRTRTNVRVLIGDIFQSHAQTWVNTVNTVGIMGKGVALGFKQRFPGMFKDYVERCKHGEVQLGKPYLYASLVPPWIVNFPTKNHWRSVSRLSDIVAGLRFLEEHYREWGITSLAVPPLGAGEGQLEWRIVGRTLYRHLSHLDISVELYAPFGTPALELEPEFLSQEPPQPARTRIPAAWVALVEIIARIERSPLHWPVGHTIFQKIAYFATESGIPTGLEYAGREFGPFAPGVKAITSKLVNNGLMLEEPLGRMIQMRPGPTHSDSITSFGEEMRQWETSIDRVVDLFLRIPTTKQAEIAASVHFAASELRLRTGGQPTEAAVLQEVLNWKLRRTPPVSEEEIARAIRTLAVLGWLEVRGSSELPLPNDHALIA
jgi:O-acetyl-ADP-ribose deacetylase (regulator of RNase III)